MNNKSDFNLGMDLRVAADLDNLPSDVKYMLIEASNRLIYGQNCIKEANKILDRAERALDNAEKIYLKFKTKAS